MKKLAAVLVFFAVVPVHASGLESLGIAGFSAAAVQPPAVPAPAPDTAEATLEDDLKPAVLVHLDRLSAHCGRDRVGCEAGGLEEFAGGLGGIGCSFRDTGCVTDVLETCRRKAADGEITPARYMTCAAMLGKLGERDCAEGRATCAGDLQGTLYFSLRAAAGCLKSFENDPRLPEAEKLAGAFAAEVNRDVKGVYVGSVEESSTIGRRLFWRAAEAGEDMVTDKVIEFALERLAWRGALEFWNATSTPYLVYSGLVLARDIAASEMNNLVCLNRESRYGGNYANAAVSVRKMSGAIQ